MKVSVIVTTYNRPDALKKVLDGLLHQTCRPHELVVADDGSGQETRDCVRSITDVASIPVRHVWQADEGFRLSMIRNKAILAAQGQYLVIMDGDCIPGPHFIEDHKKLAQAGCFFQGKRVLVNAAAQNAFTRKDIGFHRLFCHAVLNRISNRHHIIRLGWFPSYQTGKLSGVRGCNMGFFKQDLIAVNGYNQDIQGWGREDQEIVVRLYKYGIKRKENPFRAICYHLWHPENCRSNLGANDQLLAESIRQEGFYCKAGLADAERDTIVPG